MNTNPLIILGGMGPQASLHLHKLLIEDTSNHGKGPDEFPFILHASMPMPDFIASQEKTKEAIALIQATSKTLPLATAAAIGMACNTAHLLLDELSELPRHNFVSMIDAVVKDSQELGTRTVGLLASPTTVTSRLYHDTFEAAGIHVVEPSLAELNALNEVIHQVIAGTDPTTLRPILTTIAARMETQGADTILLGCTELPLVGVDGSLPVLDSLSSLARHMLANRL